METGKRNAMKNMIVLNIRTATFSLISVVKTALQFDFIMKLLELKTKVEKLENQLDAPYMRTRSHTQSSMWIKPCHTVTSREMFSLQWTCESGACAVPLAGLYSKFTQKCHLTL